MFGNKVLKFAICTIWGSTKNNRLEQILFLGKTRHKVSDRYPILDFRTPLKSDLGFFTACYCPVCSASIILAGLLRLPLLSTGATVRDPWMTVALHYAIFRADKH